ncbi:substrate-binding domain-containing protein, partial [Kineococcus glutinatus]|uniref:substrate-binding domain-containing protein n=1 Tax=Kineococcus glutinatus TaxID=1070872 RepID=UPI0031E626A2
VPEVLVARSCDATAGLDAGALLAADPDVTAVLCGNDEVAMGVISGLEDAGVRVPADVSVAGFDDHPLAQVWRPGLTTARQDFPDLGRRALALLLTRAGGDLRAVASSTRPPVVLRGSTAAPPAAPRVRSRPATAAADAPRPAR